MNLKLVRKNNHEISGAEISSIAEKQKLHPKLVELLLLRGVQENQIKDFLYPHEGMFHDPMTMKGMPEAVERLNVAIDKNETIVVYGDYDVDGVCSTAILSLYLAQRGVTVYTHIPNRIDDGYGLNTESIEKIIEDCSPDIILTCDCGISGYKEVEEAQDLGVEVIVTDHHEVSENIPDCIVVNPHQVDCKYPFKFLCGAGVALKLVEALGGISAARDFWDLAAIATIADLVPLIDENRLIVQLGLGHIDNIKNIGLKMLLQSQKINGDILSSDIAFKIAPRINAAGRMGDAYRSFELLTKDNKLEIADIINDIDEDNLKRKNLCTKLYNEAIEDMKKEDIVNRRCIVLSHPEWEKGITGIVAARLSGEFHRPSFILVKSGDLYKGTARSVDGINLYNLLSNVSDLLIEYGGHSQAAGFSIKAENIELFKERVAEYLEDFPRKFFEPVLSYDLDISDEDINMDLVRSMDLLEPTGNGNPKPLYRLNGSKFKVQLCNNVAHTQITTQNNLFIFAFNNYARNQFLKSDGIKSLVFELQTSVFNKKESMRGILRGISNEKLTFGNDAAKAAFIRMSRYRGDVSPKFDFYTKVDLENLIGNNIYGVMIICGSGESYQNFIESYNRDNIILHEFICSTSLNNYTRIIVSPEFNSNLLLSSYEKIIFLDVPISNNIISYINEHTDAKIYIPDCAECVISRELSTDRNVFAYYYDLFRKYRDVKASSVWEFYKIVSMRSKVSLLQFFLCLTVFEDLGFIAIGENDFSLKINNGVKTKLSSSNLYKYLSELYNG